MVVFAIVSTTFWALTAERQRQRKTAPPPALADWERTVATRATQAEVLTLLLKELNRFEMRVASLVASNEERIALTHSYLKDSSAQIANRHNKNPQGPLRENLSFLKQAYRLSRS
jgi:3-polyprenyl-4-hydroxybenzoate decarboxylase